MPVSIVRDSEDSNYPYPVKFLIGDPLDSRSRRSMRDHAMRSLYYADVRDFKLIETYAQFELRLKHVVDVAYVELLAKCPLDSTFKSTFSLPAKKQKYPSEARKLKNVFKNAVRAADMEDNVFVSINRDTNDVVVLSTSLADFMKCWKCIPHAKRYKITAHTNYSPSRA